MVAIYIALAKESYIADTCMPLELCLQIILVGRIMSTVYSGVNFAAPVLKWHSLLLGLFIINEQTLHRSVKNNV